MSNKYDTPVMEIIKLDGIKTDNVSGSLDVNSEVEPKKDQVVVDSY